MENNNVKNINNMTSEELEERWREYEEYDNNNTEYWDKLDSIADAYTQTFKEIYGSTRIDEIEVKPSIAIIHSDSIVNLNMAEMTYIDEQKVINQ